MCIRDRPQSKTQIFKEEIKLANKPQIDIPLGEPAQHKPGSKIDISLDDDQPPITNGSPLTIGSRGIVLREIPQGDIGRVRVDGLDWQARTVDGTPLPKDACCEVKNVDGAVPVSYTHLDVYKRQD